MSSIMSDLRAGLPITSGSVFFISFPIICKKLKETLETKVDIALIHSHFLSSKEADKNGK